MFWFFSNTVYIKEDDDNRYKLKKYYSLYSGEVRHFNSNHVSSILKTNQYEFLGVKKNYSTPKEYDAEVKKLSQCKMYIAFINDEAIEIDEEIFNKLLNTTDNKKELC